MKARVGGSAFEQHGLEESFCTHGKGVGIR